MIDNRVVFNVDLQRSSEKKHDNALYWKDSPRWDSVDPEQSLTKIREYFESLQGTNNAPCSYMLRPHIVPLMHKNQAIGLWSDPKKKVIERCPIIPIKQHVSTMVGQMPSYSKRCMTCSPPSMLLTPPCVLPS